MLDVMALQLHGILANKAGAEFEDCRTTISGGFKFRQKED